MAMHSEKQYLDLYQSSSRVIKKNSAEVLNAVRDAAYETSVAWAFLLER